ncbi:CRISPR-associated protein Cas1 [Thermodesulfatator indicus DSM 15286]|uniref:CRISPR-associated endonuclease Cas1 n=1 Tax=Thermodesulfatator indicus (strain DSM 15286 / JCM 11887 / CIR29812) TaxID=667014 RepID=F8A9J2_THEID|nr:CRISPR-associated endonuclease Cas1 [Thermodesulfatator indicus]AEH45218.1 CRISPR-associated protein Cas1 [Thermodesulfatator indicus DSM 15286]
MALYITEQGLKVRKEGQRLQFYKEKNVVREFRLDDLDEIYVFGRLNFSAAALQALLKHEIKVHFLTASGKYLGRLAPPRGKNVELRLAQFRAFDNEKRRLEIARAVIAGKIRNQKNFLRRQNRKLKNEKIGQAILKLRHKIKEAEDAQSLESLRGIEGQAAQVYFDVFGKLFQVEGLKFPGRIRRPPPDPINALLSLGYTLLFAQIWSVAESTGFDPYLGFLHVPEYGRPSLVLDLAEEWRPLIVDSLVVRLFNWKAVKPEDFTEEPWDDEEDFTSFKLTPDGLRKFLAKFRERLDEEALYAPLNKRLSYRYIMQQQVWHLARVLDGREEKYQAFSLE